ncbi:host cell surface-exposed lipoprotein [Cytobacillus firmus]|uniref:Host cell surface-exposed lipoprotein n=2 Tax=Cytobacillus TaxID=2675230 RepID=A0A366JLY3_CYTFI|nr:MULTISPECIES: Ltp family lipoprotein [Cytobacillus]RBP87896.1 host cell surface-exposed lipoprotein [Cytobacillus firmus]TDX39259.1 host cell surface-exposed lipoprotein [Cytobacillus oceanisediminis]
MKEKVKKPFYKKWWVYVVAFIIIGALASGGEESAEPANTEVKQETAAKEASSEVKETKEEEPVKEEKKIPTEFKSALNQAETYSDTFHLSKAGLFDQLTSEYGGQFSQEAAQYAIDNIKADWNKNALEQAKTYQEEMSMSPEAIRDQLTSEHGGQFTQEEADYAVESLE